MLFSLWYLPTNCHVVFSSCGVNAIYQPLVVQSGYRYDEAIVSEFAVCQGPLNGPRLL